MRYADEPKEFLPRLLPAARGSLPPGPFKHRWFGRAPSLPGVDLLVMSKPVGAAAVYVVADRSGHWLAWSSPRGSADRRLLGSTRYGLGRFARAFEVRV